MRRIDALAADLGTDPASSGFRGYLLSSIVSGPSGVEALLKAAAANGATVVRSAKKRLFGEFTAVYLGVAEPKASKAFYEKLGMRAEHDYGDKFIDFTAADGVFRLDLLPRRGLARGAGVGTARASPLSC
ncbi:MULTISPECIES: hypothetical protein [unclassified Nocardiopsis]|uniref:hypothetical protein n=1 Tax=unclassified Nocardiopsis TaxID=2649073 RepID=UPI00135CB40F|nr:MULTISPECIES: hypothetical protein [unclassified Nocardiopsis]